MVDEFLEFVAGEWTGSDRIPQYLRDLARHEALRIQIGSLRTRDAKPIAPELALEHSVGFIEAVRVVRYQHPVHELSDDEDDRTVPEPRSVNLLVYRSPEHEVRYLELTPMAAQLLEALLTRGVTLREALLEAAGATGNPLDTTTISGTAGLLADLAQRGVLRAAAVPPASS